MSNACAECGRDAAHHCSKCKSTHYCSRECQAAAWPKHKRECVLLTAGASARGSAPPVDAGAKLLDMDSLQASIDAAPVGARLLLPAGTISASLRISKAVTLWGSGTYGSTLESLLTLSGGTAANVVHVRNVIATGGVKVEKAAHVTLQDVRISNAGGVGVHSFGHLTLFSCTIQACREDGILAAEGALHVEKCSITHCGEDGIFSNMHVYVKDTVIQLVGRHGIKGRAGTTRKGVNDIQPSPWDNAPPLFGGGAGMAPFVTAMDMTSAFGK